ncbi:MAG: hypothetical protein ABSA68_14980 [Xanthobacteraceae bacterium]
MSAGLVTTSTGTLTTKPRAWHAMAAQIGDVAQQDQDASAEIPDVATR